MMNKNNKNEGIVEFLIYPEDGKYVGVCLTFDLLEEDDDFETLKKTLTEAAMSHIQVVTANNLSEELLNRPAPQEYWDKYEELKATALTEKIRDLQNEKVPVSKYFSTYQNGVLAVA